MSSRTNPSQEANPAEDNDKCPPLPDPELDALAGNLNSEERRDMAQTLERWAWDLRVSADLIQRAAGSQVAVTDSGGITLPLACPILSSMRN